MTFEGFDAAPVIEGAAFWASAALPAEMASDQADTLEAALRAAGQADQAQGSPACGCGGGAGRAAARAEARMIDLWIGEAGDIAMRPIERPSLAASASWQALLAQAGGDFDFGAGMKINALRASYTAPPEPGEYVDENGNGQYDEGELIIVRGARPNSMNEGAFWEPNMGDDTGDDGGGGNQGGFPQPNGFKDCAKDNKALEVATQINSMAEGGFEYGAAIYKDANGHIVAGPIGYGTVDGTVAMFVPPGVGILNLMGQVHSHPARGNPALDAAYAVADMYPSPVDWATMGQLALRVLEAGGDPNQLSIYIIDHNGFVREFSYADRMTYDVPESQLLQQPGQPPLPPLPGPMLAMRVCSAGS